MNLRPSGYEPDELPGCSTPRQFCMYSQNLGPALEGQPFVLVGPDCLSGPDAIENMMYTVPIFDVRFEDLATTYSPTP